MINQNKGITDENKFFIKVLNCPVCNESIKLLPKFSIDYFSNRVIELININEIPEIELIRCSVCTHSFSSYILRPEILNNYYSNINLIKNQNSSVNLIDSHEKDRRKQAYYIEKAFPKGGKILDVGCSYGFLLTYLDKTKWNCYGVEPSLAASEIAKRRGINILSQYVAQLMTQQNTFDVILLIDVIEHLSEPQKLVEHLYTLLKYEGSLVIITGNIGSLNAKLAGRKWVYFNSYEHISFFNPNSLAHLLKANLFKKVKVKKISYEKGILKNSYSFLKNLIRYVLFRKLKLRKLNVSPLAFDHMMVIGRK